MDDFRKIVKSSYNSCAQNYSDDRDLFKNEKYLEDLTKKLSKGVNILDIGCGSGVPIDKYLIEHEFTVTGIDISEEQINLAQKKLPSGQFLIKDMTEVNFPVNSFDAIVSFYAIFHIPRVKHLTLLKKLNSMNDKTKWLSANNNGSSDWEGIEDNFHEAKMFWSHYGREKNIELVKEVGFKLIYETIDTSGCENP